MADAEIAPSFTGIAVRLRCPRCRVLLDISGLDARHRFLCGGCRLNTDVAACAATTEGLRLRWALRLAMGAIPAGIAGFMFGFIQGLVATGFAHWGESALAAGLFAAGCALAAAGVVFLSVSPDAPRAAARTALAAMTAALGAWLRWRAGTAAVSDTMMTVLDVVAVFWLCVAVFNIVSLYRPPAAKQVARVVEVDNLKA